MEINKTTVRIAGKEYPISGKESEEYIHRVAIYVDRKIQELERRYTTLSSSEIAVLAAINVTDELLKLRDELSAMEEGTWRETKAAQPADEAAKKNVPAANAKHFFAKSK